MGGRRSLRMRVLLGDYAVVVAVVLVLAVLSGAALVYTTHVDPGTETETQVIPIGESSVEYTHSSTVTEQNRLYPTGMTLEDQSVYYTSIGSELDATFAYTLDAPDGELDVDITSTLIIREVTDDAEIWRLEETLSAESTTIASGETATAAFTVDIAEILDEIDAVQDDLGASPGDTEVVIETDVDASGTAGGEGITHTDSYELEIDPGSQTFSVDDPGTQTESHDRTEVATVERDHGPIRSAGGPLLLVVSLLGLAGLAVAQRQGALTVTADDRAALEMLDEHAEFDDWISAGRVPESVRERDAITVSSLSDLVDAAIDCDRRVVYDEVDGSYHVIDDAVRYEYAPPTPVTDATEIAATQTVMVDTGEREKEDVTPDGEPGDGTTVDADAEGSD